MEFQQQQAIYLQIADHICENILRKIWQANDKIPSIREMAVTTEVNPNTIARTYTYLEEKKIITKQRGIGYFVAEDGYQKVLDLKKQLFFQHEAPRIFKTFETMKLLNISLDDLQKLFDEHTKKRRSYENQ